MLGMALNSVHNGLIYIYQWNAIIEEMGFSLDFAVLAWAHLINIAVHGMDNIDDTMRGAHFKVYGYEVGYYRYC